MAESTIDTSIDSSAPVSLRLVDDDNVRAVMDLSVLDSQDSFVAPNAISLGQAFATTNVWVRAIYAGDEPVGFAMLSDDEDKPRYYLWRFMIDGRYQRRGFGSAALGLVHDYVRTRPGGDRIYLSYVRADGGPEAFYKAHAYEDTGREHDGELEAVCQLG